MDCEIVDKTLDEYDFEFVCVSEPAKEQVKNLFQQLVAANTTEQGIFVIEKRPFLLRRAGETDMDFQARQDAMSDELRRLADFRNTHEREEYLIEADKFIRPAQEKAAFPVCWDEDGLTLHFSAPCCGDSLAYGHCIALFDFLLYLRLCSKIRIYEWQNTMIRFARPSFDALLHPDSFDSAAVFVIEREHGRIEHRMKLISYEWLRYESDGNWYGNEELQEDYYTPEDYWLDNGGDMMFMKAREAVRNYEKNKSSWKKEENIYESYYPEFQCGKSNGTERRTSPGA